MAFCMGIVFGAPERGIGEPLTGIHIFVFFLLGVLIGSTAVLVTLGPSKEKEQK
jgi:hypothetical protein